MIYGYARVSKEEQNLQNQIDQLKDAGCEKLYYESITTRKEKRSEWEKVKSLLLSGDVLIVVSIDRCARSVYELVNLMEEFRIRDVQFKVLRSPWLDTTSAMGKFVFTIFAGVAEFERDLISQRTKEGLARVKRNGGKLGRPTRITPETKEAVFNGIRMGLSKAHMARTLKISERTLYRILDES